MAGVHPKTVQTVMRHSTITLTMDTYGHLFPGQEADAVGRLRDMMIADTPQTLQATGTDDHTAQSAESAQRQAQRATRQRGHKDARQCDEAMPNRAKKKSPKPLEKQGQGELVRADARSSGGGTRNNAGFPGENGPS